MKAKVLFIDRGYDFMIIILSFATENDKSKFEYIYDHYKKLLLYKAYQVLNDYSLAEDALSEAFIRIYKNLHKIDDVQSPQTISFLVTIVKNISITLLNREKRGTIEELADYDEKDGFNLEELVVSQDVAENVLKIIETLKDELKAPFLLKYAHDLSHKEISGILNISENNVTVRIHRAKKKLAGLLKKEGNVYGI